MSPWIIFKWICITVNFVILFKSFCYEVNQTHYHYHCSEVMNRITAVQNSSCCSLLQPESSRQIPQRCQTTPFGTVRNTEHWHSNNRSMADMNLSILQHPAVRSPWSDPYLSIIDLLSDRQSDAIIIVLYNTARNKICTRYPYTM